MKHLVKRLAASVACATLAACGGGTPKSASPSKSDAAATQPVAPADPPKIAADKIEASLSAASQYIQAQDYAKAAAILVTLVDRAPDEPRGHELYGQTLISMALQADARHDIPAAKECRRKAYEQYRIAVRLQPDSAGLIHSTGQMAMEAGDRAAALDYFQAAGRIDPKNPQHPLFEAQVLIQDKRFDEARAAVNKSLTIDPDIAIAHASLAMIDLEEGKFDTALADIAQARQLEPADVGFRAQEARIHRRAGHPEKALELLTALGPDDRAQEIVAFELAACHEALNDPMSAAKAWEWAAKRDPLGPRAWYAAAKVAEELLKAGDREQARLWLQQAQTMAPPDAPEIAALASKLE